MKIGIIGAMKEEINLLQEDLINPIKETFGKRDYFTGKLYNQHVTLVFSRWGKVASASTTTTLIDRFGVDLVIFTGVAGAISSQLNIGDIVISSELVQHDLDVSKLQIYKRFEVPLLGRTHFQADLKYIELSKESALHYIENEMHAEIDSSILQEFNIRKPTVIVGLIASGDQFISNQEVVNKLRSDLIDLQCVEMEGAAVAQVCFEYNVPVVVIRSISDKADHSAIIDFPGFTDKVASYFSRGVVRNLLLNLK
jgi:adenosylhomocysteine nucleosidase